MITKGIRIYDHENHIIVLELTDILDEINNFNEFCWCVLYSDITPKTESVKFVMGIQEETDKSRDGIIIPWKRLRDFSNGIFQSIDLGIIACKDKALLHRYEDDQEMYETCDIVIEMIDSGYWEVFSKDEQLINRLAEKFKNTEFLDSDFEK